MLPLLSTTQKRTGKVLALEEREATRDQHNSGRSEDQYYYAIHAIPYHAMPRKGGPAQVRTGGQSRLDCPLSEPEREGVLLHQRENLRCAFLRDLQVTEAKLHLVHVIGGGGGCKWDGRTREWSWRRVKLDVRGWPGEAEPGGEEREAVQHLARFEACA